MRKINTGDVFKAARLIKRGNIMPAVRTAYTRGKEKNADAEEIGIDTAMEVIASCTEPEVEKQFYDLLSGICEKTPEDIRDQSLEVTVADIRRICEENDIINFWKSASRLGEMI